MHIFGNQTDVKIAVFTGGSTPSIGKLKKIFSCPSVKVFKASGRNGHHLRRIEEFLLADAAFKGETYERFPYDAEFAILDKSAYYTVFTIAAHVHHLLGVFKLDVALYQRLEKILMVRRQLESELRLCASFISSVNSINKNLAKFDEADPVCQRFDPDAFLQQYGEIGHQGRRAIDELLQAEVRNIRWEAYVPAYESEDCPSDIQIQDLPAKAASQMPRNKKAA